MEGSGLGNWSHVVWTCSWGRTGRAEGSGAESTCTKVEEQIDVACVWPGGQEERLSQVGSKQVRRASWKQVRLHLAFQGGSLTGLLPSCPAGRFSCFSWTTLAPYPPVHVPSPGNPYSLGRSARPPGPNLSSGGEGHTSQGLGSRSLCKAPEAPGSCASPCPTWGTPSLRLSCP